MHTTAAVRLLSITHSTGRRVDVQYLAPGDDSLISALVVAGQPVVSYTYSPAGELTTATYADGASRTYHYEDARFPGYLTGITAEGSQRYSWYGYDARDGSPAAVTPATAVRPT